MVNPQNPRYTEGFQKLLEIMNDLREKCPWDKKQSIESLRYLSIEEVYELSDAIVEKDWLEIKKELGDILLHIVFYAKMASEQNKFDIGDVLEQICEKLIRRHPHIYGELQVQDAEEVRRNWERIKQEEQGEKPKSILAGVPSSLPAMVKAIRVQEKARGAGFDWDDKTQVWQKVEEEMQEFRAHFSLENEKVLNEEEAEKEFGDLLFSLVNYARFVGINPENALEKTNKKFIGRFQYMEKAIAEKGQKLTDLPLEEMDIYWNEAKKLGI